MHWQWFLIISGKHKQNKSENSLNCNQSRKINVHWMQVLDLIWSAVSVLAEFWQRTNQLYASISSSWLVNYNVREGWGKKIIPFVKKLIRNYGKLILIFWKKKKMGKRNLKVFRIEIENYILENSWKNMWRKRLLLIYNDKNFISIKNSINRIKLLLQNTYCIKYCRKFSGNSGNSGNC